MKFASFWGLMTLVTLGHSWSIRKGSEAREEVTYVGAVLEYEPYSLWSDTEKGYGVIRQNAQVIKDYAAQAKAQAADILVAPEYGLQSLNMFPEDLDKFLTFTQYVPDPANNVVPFSSGINNTKFEGMQILSSAAMDQGIYLSIDLGELYPCSEDTVMDAPWPIQPDENCPENGYFFYNTVVVFDRMGKVIARYRKQHLYGESFYTPGPADDMSAVFMTDFDVQFTLQTCFDIAFEHPGYSNIKSLGIKDVVMSTAWVDYLPFNMADSTQNAWTRGLGVNLLVSGYHKPEKSKLGSGIYKAYSQELPDYIYDKDSGNVLIVSQVTTTATTNKVHKDHLRNHKIAQDNPIVKKSVVSASQTSNERRIHVMVHQNLSNFTRVILESGESGVARTSYVCSYDQFCCNLTYEYTGNLTYMFVGYSGQFSPGIDFLVGFQACGVLWCKTQDINTCTLVEAGLPHDDNFGPFTISSSSFAVDSIYPGGNVRNLSLISNDILQYDVTGNNYTIFTTQPVSNLLVAALYGRWYSHDGISN